MLRWLLLLVGLGYVVYEESQKFLDKYTLSLSGVSFNSKQSEKENFQYLFFDVSFALTNPTALQAEVSRIHYDVFFKGQKVATFDRNYSITVPANSRINIEGTIKIDTLKVLSLATAIEEGIKAKTIDLKFVGSLDVGIGQVNINFDYSVPL